MKDKGRMPANLATETELAGTGAEEAAGDYTTTTRGIRVSVRSFFLEDQSQPDERQYLWAYRIRIENHGREHVRLLRRSWQITDGNGHTDHVQGEGVVGEQPTIQPGDSYSYASGCPLGTASGSMVGGYHMEDAEGRMFEVAIPAFSLDVPGERRVLN